MRFLCWQVERSPGKGLWQRRRDQNHHEDYISRGSYPEARKLWKRLSFCSFCFQTAWFQVAQTDGLQRENGKCVKEWKLQTHNMENVWTLRRALVYKWIQTESSFMFTLSRSSFIHFSVFLPLAQECMPYMYFWLWSAPCWISLQIISHCLNV